MISFKGQDFLLKSKLMHNARVLVGTQTVRKASSTEYMKKNDYQYLEVNKTPTMHFQKSLPHLKVPDLNQTCEKYLKAQRPLLSDSKYEETKSYVSNFCKNEGPVIQKELLKVDKLNRDTNYVSKYWFDMYLRDRKPLPINYNPMLVMALEEDTKYNSQLVKATNITISALRFMKSLEANVLAPEVFALNPAKCDSHLYYVLTRYSPSFVSTYVSMLFKAFPLDMSQYHNLFRTTRIPELEKDRIYEAQFIRHIVIMRRGHFYSFNVLDENGSLITPREIAANLKYILNDNAPKSRVPIGILTACERNEWAKLRSHLETLDNSHLLKIIDSAIFVLNLDDEEMGGNNMKLIRNYLHGDGTNRWFDKSISLIISKDGYAGINFEHSWGDGVAVLRFLKDVKEDTSKKPKFHPDDTEYLDEITANAVLLDFTVDKKIEHAVEVEKQKFDKWIKELSAAYIIYDGFGKNQCKKLGVSPDAVMQLAFQLAIYNQRGHLVPTYESCSTAAFKHGRTETMRPCTMQTKTVCAAMSKKDTMSKSELQKLIIECSNAHMRLTKAAAMGQGFDRHLFVLKKMLEESGKSMPDIFRDPAYEEINRNVLSTSTLSSPAVIAGGFGPTIPEGYGIGYMIQNEKLGAIVTAYKEHCDAGDYVKSLEEACISIHKVLTRE